MVCKHTGGAQDHPRKHFFTTLILFTTTPKGKEARLNNVGHRNAITLMYSSTGISYCLQTTKGVIRTENADMTRAAT